jgi:hypothetical protein
MVIHFCPENAAAAINAKWLPGLGQVALVSWTRRRFRSRKRPALERESKVQKKE